MLQNSRLCCLHSLLGPEVESSLVASCLALEKQLKRNVLEHKLRDRPDIIDLEARNILHDTDVTVSAGSISMLILITILYLAFARKMISQTQGGKNRVGVGFGTNIWTFCVVFPQQMDHSLAGIADHLNDLLSQRREASDLVDLHILPGTFFSPFHDFLSFSRNGCIISTQSLMGK